MPTLKRKLLYIGGAALVLVLLFKSCKGPEDLVDVSQLPASTDLHVAVKGRVITVRTHNGVESNYIPDRGRADVIVNNEGEVALNIKSTGLTLQPVIGVFLAKSPSLAVGAQVAYWKRAELYVGGAYPWAGWVGAGYKLDQLFLSNTSLFANYTTRKEIGVGVLVRF